MYVTYINYFIRYRTVRSRTCTIALNQGCKNHGFEFSKPEVTRGYLESQVILAQNLNLEVFFVLVLTRTSRMYGWQQGFSRGIIE